MAMVLCRPPLAWIMGHEKIRLVARKRHYRDHLLPIWDKLPDEYKLTDEWERFDRLLIAGWPDVRHGHPYVYVEHGAGQSYVDTRSAGWSGGEHHHECELFICPNQSVADRWQARYPETPTAVVGCPRLDKYHDGTIPPPQSKTVAITFHWDCRIVPETRSAFEHYRKGIPAMVNAYRAQGWAVYGHEHPRWAGKLKRYWRTIGVEYTDDPLRDASVLVADNTSLMAEFLSCGRPVIALNAPWYRKAVHHGERFWTWSVEYADSAKEAAGYQLDSLTTPSQHPYAFADGRAAERAAHAIIDLLTHTGRPKSSRPR